MPSAYCTSQYSDLGLLPLVRATSPEPMENLWDVQEKALHSGSTLLPSKQYLGEKSTHRMETNLDIAEGY